MYKRAHAYKYTSSRRLNPPRLSISLPRIATWKRPLRQFALRSPDRLEQSTHASPTIIVYPGAVETDTLRKSLIEMLSVREGMIEVLLAVRDISSRRRVMWRGRSRRFRDLAFIRESPFLLSCVATAKSRLVGDFPCPTSRIRHK